MVRSLEKPQRFFTSPAFLFLLPMLIYIFIWRIFPLLYTVFLSTQSWNIMYRREPTFIGLQNYQKAFEPGSVRLEDLQKAFGNSFKYAAFTVGLGTPLALALATW